MAGDVPTKVSGQIGEKPLSEQRVHTRMNSNPAPRSAFDGFINSLQLFGLGTNSGGYASPTKGMHGLLALTPLGRTGPQLPGFKAR